MERFFKSSEKGGKSHERAMQFLSGIVGNNSNVRVEIENSPHFFYSPVMMRGGAVVLTIPVKMQEHLNDGDWVRFAIPEQGKEDLRLQVSNQEHLELGTIAKIFCRLPSVAVEPRRRVDHRYYTAHFKDLLLELPNAKRFPVLDLSIRGLRIDIQMGKSIFSIGKSVGVGSKIRMGKRATIALEDVIPRFLGEEVAGLEYRIEGENLSQKKILSVFLESIDKEIRRLGEET